MNNGTIVPNLATAFIIQRAYHNLRRLREFNNTHNCCTLLENNSQYKKKNMFYCL